MMASSTPNSLHPTKGAPRTGPRVVIVGGVAGGMSCATRLRRLDETARITVLEGGPYVSYANCGIPYALGGVIADEAKLHVQTPDKIAAWFDVDVRTCAEVVAVDRAGKSVTVRVATGGQGEGDGDGAGSNETTTTTTEALPYDKLVLATGSEPWVPPQLAAAVDAGATHVFGLHTIPDLRRIQAHIASSCTPADDGSPGSHGRCTHAAVVGAGFIGLEAAENLARLGLHVSLLEYTSHVFPAIDADVAEPLHAELRRQGVRLFLDARVSRIAAADPATGRPAQIEHSTAVLPVPDEDADDRGSTTVTTSRPQEPVRADLVIVAAGVRPRSALARAAGLAVDPATGGVLVDAHMRSVSDADVYAVGDVAATRHLVLGRDVPVALAGPANRQGRLAADHICGLGGRGPGDDGDESAAAGYRGNVGTSVCRVFDRVVALVGLSTAALDRMPGMRRGETYEYVTVHPPSHAGYYPGAEPTTMKLAFAVPSGRILGAQIVGGGRDGSGGVDKRIDVLATAMRAGMTVRDLEHLELAYAPPFGSAKDPVNMAGFVASNVLQGLVAIVHAEDLVHIGGRDDRETAAEAGASGRRRRGLAGYRVVDVRSPDEYAAGHVRGAVNVPLGDLRDAATAGMLGGDHGMPLLVYCWVGYRGYIAYRVLRQMGFDVVNLDGGFKNVSQGGYISLCEDVAPKKLV